MTGSLNANNSASAYLALPETFTVFGAIQRLTWGSGKSLQAGLYIGDDSNRQCFMSSSTSAGRWQSYLWNGSTTNGPTNFWEEAPTDFRWFILRKSGDTITISKMIAGTGEIESQATLDDFDVSLILRLWNTASGTSLAENINAAQLAVFDDILDDSEVLDAILDPVAAGAYAYFRLDSVTDWWVDQSGNTNDLTPSGTPVYSSNQPPELDAPVEPGHLLAAPTVSRPIGAMVRGLVAAPTGALFNEPIYNVIVVGSSIAAGYVTAGPTYSTYAIARANGLESLRSDVVTVNAATEGVDNGYLASVYESQVLAFYDPTKINILLHWEISNSIWGGGDGGDPPNPVGDPATVLAEIEAYAANAQADGFLVWAGTSIPTSYAPEEVVFNELDELIRESTVFDAIVDFHTISDFYPPGPGNSLYYDSLDSTHPSDTGQQLLTQFFSDFLSSAFLDPAEPRPLVAAPGVTSPIAALVPALTTAPHASASFAAMVGAPAAAPAVTRPIAALAASSSVAPTVTSPFAALVRGLLAAPFAELLTLIEPIVLVLAPTVSRPIGTLPRRLDLVATVSRPIGAMVRALSAVPIALQGGFANPNRIVNLTYKWRATQSSGVATATPPTFTAYRGHSIDMGTFEIAGPDDFSFSDSVARLRIGDPGRAAFVEWRSNDVPTDVLFDWDTSTRNLAIDIPAAAVDRLPPGAYFYQITIISKGEPLGPPCMGTIRVYATVGAIGA